MRLAHVIEAVMHKPWAITSEGHRSIVWALEKKLSRSLIEASDEDAKRVFSAERQGLFGPLDSMEIKGTTAFIPVHGILARKVSMIEKSCGVVDYCDIEDDIDEAVNDPNVKSILLDIDSPGGTVNGLYEAFDKIKAASGIKPIIAFTEGQMCSAAYYLACGCTAIVASPSSSVGSIGCVLQALDDSKAYQDAGLKMNTLRSDPLKAIGCPGDEITPEQIAYLQAIVDECAARFKETVINQRGLISEDALDGRVFSADEALAYSLIDLVANEEEEALALIK